MGNIVAVLVIPYLGNLSDKIGRRIPNMVGAVGTGVLSFGSPHAITIHNVPVAELQRGVPEVLSRDVPDVDAAVGHGHFPRPGTLVIALLPALFVAVAPPGATDIPLMIGATALGVTTIAVIVAWTAREVCRIAMNDLGNRYAEPLSVPEVKMNVCASTPCATDA